jgi:hypothetical protein
LWKWSDTPLASLSSLISILEIFKVIFTDLSSALNSGISYPFQIQLFHVDIIFKTSLKTCSYQLMTTSCFLNIFSTY